MSSVPMMNAAKRDNGPAVVEGLRMKFVLEVELNALAPEADTTRELGRILRYWAGNLHHYALAPGDGSAIYDSNYSQVGQWSVIGSDSAPPDPPTHA